MSEVYNTEKEVGEAIRESGIPPSELYITAKQLQSAWTELEAIFATGRVGAIGVSNFTKSHVDTRLKTARIRPSVNQIELNPYLQRKELQQYHKENDIQTFAFSPLSPIVRANPGPLDDVLDRISQEHRVSTAVVLIRWALQQGIAVVTNSTSADRMKDHLLALDVALSDDEVALISAVGSEKHFRGRWTNIFAVDDRS